MHQQLNICHVVTSLARRDGGTSAFVAELANAQAHSDTTAITVVTPARDVEDVALGPNVVRAAVPPADAQSWLQAWQRARSPGIIHVHGLWLPFTHSFSRAAARLGIPLMLSPHGMLEPRALSLKFVKKQLALLAYQRRDLHAADFLHATAQPEAQTLHDFGLKQPITVVPPGLEMPAIAAMREWLPERTRQALYFSRIHPKKNLLGLLDAWAAIAPAKWALRIVGPDDGEHSATVRRKIEALQLNQSVTLEGPIYGAEKQDMFRSASLFILPSFTENFGIVVAEALAYGVPVITTHGTPWRCLEEYDCGWWVAPDHNSLLTALSAATASPDDRLKAMGLRGRRLVEERFQWTSVADSMQAAYSWALGRGPRPDCVLLQEKAAS